MMVAMEKDATPEQIAVVIAKIREFDMKPIDLPGGERTAVGIASAIPPELRENLTAILEVMPGVDRVTQVSRAYKLASREFHPTSTTFKVGQALIGGDRVAVIAGPCAVENEDQMMEAAKAVKAAGASVLRGGAFKPRTSPYSFQGLGLQGLIQLKRAGEAVGLPIVTEVVDQHEVELVAEFVDILQVGARNMQNFPLLTAVGRANKPVLLKRGPSATIDEWLLSAEYVLQGNDDVILCERGIHPIDRTHTRYTLDLSAVPVIKSLSHLPIVIDPSHASGNWKLVESMSRAAVAAGADGLLIEVHPDPLHALCDGPQSLRPDKFELLMGELRAVAKAVGREL